MLKSAFGCARCATFLLVLATGCVGAIGDEQPGALDNGHAGNSGGGASTGTGTTGTGTGNSTGSSNPNPPSGAASDAPGKAELRLLTQDEYANTIRDLLASPTATIPALPADTTGGNGFHIPANASTGSVERYSDAAQSLSGALVTKFTMIAGCGKPLASDEACAHKVISTFGKQAYRRPLDQTEVDGLVVLLKQVQGAPLQYAVPDALRVVVQAMLQSPSFLYHREGGLGVAVTEKGLVRRNSYEIASRLSYFLWTTMPDPALFVAADAGRLQTPDEIEQQARRMVMDARIRGATESFHPQWLALSALDGLAKDPAKFPTYGPMLVDAMKQETGEFTYRVLGPEGDGKMATLLTAPYSYANGALAGLYAVSGVAKTAPMGRVMLDATRRAGLLTQPAFLAVGAKDAETLPPRRGNNVFAIANSFRCSPILMNQH